MLHRTIACTLLMFTGSVLAERPLGIDISMWQGSISSSQWTQIYNSGRVFAFIKASQGTIVTDPNFYTNISRARSAGLLVSPYHFADPLNARQPNEPPHTAVDEANWFVQVAGNYMTSGHLPPVLDLEAGSTMGKTALSDWVNDFCNRVVTLTGVRPIIYTNTNYAVNYVNSSVTQWDLWIANWGYTDPQTQSPPTGVWPTWKFWQYSSTGSVPGISGDVDLDVFNGTIDQLRQYVIGDPAEILLDKTSITISVRSGRTVPDESFVLTAGGDSTLYYNISDNVSWLDVSPVSGELPSGQSQPVQVSFSADTLPIDTYTAAIVVSAGGAINTPQLISVSLTIEPVPGDLDRDKDIDGADVNLFIDCLAGPGVQVRTACLPADLDGDGDVDNSDFGTMQKCISGPSVPANPDCPDN